MDDISANSQPADTTTPPVVEETPQEDYSYKEVHETPVAEIANDKPEETKPPVEEIKEEVPPVVPEKEEIDPVKLAEDVAAKVAESLQPKEEDIVVETKSTSQEYKDWATKFEEDNGRKPDWNDVAELASQKAEERIQKRQEDAQKAIDEERAVKEDADKRATESFNKIVDEDLNDLYESNKLTKVVNKDNPEDQGMKERESLFKAMLEVNKTRIQEGKRPIMSIKEIYYEHYTKPTAQPAGEDAPISAGQNNAAAPTEEVKEYSNADLKKPWTFFGNR